MVKRCNDGKSCGATCISKGKACEVDLSASASKSLSKSRDLIERVQEKLDAAVAVDKPLEAEAEVVQYVKDNYEKWLTGGMDDRFYGGPGQRGSLDAKVWMLGQEAYANSEGRFGINVKNPDPTAAVNAIRLHNNLYEIARKEAGDRKYVTGGVEDFFGRKLFNLDNSTTVEQWVSTKPNTYFGRLGRILKDLGYSGNLLGANASSFLQPSGQKALDNLTKLLEKNGVNTKTFANGAFRSKESWYKASVEARYPLMMKALKRHKPSLVYIGAQVEPNDRKSFANMLLYKMSREAKLPVQHFNHDGFDYKYVLVPLPGGKRTVVLNGWHPTGLKGARVAGEGGVKRQEKFLTDLIRNLRDKGEPPEGIVAKPVEESVMSRVLG